MTKSTLFALALTSAALLGGCGSGGGATSQEDAAFKSHDRSAIKGPPPGAVRPDATFKSSLGGARAAAPASGG